MSTIYRHLSKESLSGEKDSQSNSQGRKSSSGLGVKFFIVLSFVFSLVAFVSSLFLFRQLQAERKAKTSMEAEQIQFRDKSKSMEEQTANFKKESEAFKKQIDELAEERDNLKKAIEDKQKQLSSIQGQLQKVTSELNEMKKKAQSVVNVASNATAAVAADSTKSVSSMTAPQSIISNVQPVGASTSKTPRVLTVNRKFNFVVVNLGMKDQMKVGDVLTVEKNGKFSGTIKIEKLYENFSAAAIENENSNSPIAEGDPVRKG